MIGAGRHASRLIYSSFPLLKDAEVVANADLDEARATSIAKLYGIPKSYTDYRAMLDAEKPDGVIICVNSDFHGRVAVELMEAGFHVYTEKPPAIDLAQVRQMLAAQKRTGKICMCAFKKRFAPAYQKARAVIEREDFGNPTLLTLTRTSGNVRGGDDSINVYLRENSIHVVDLVTYLFGKVSRVSAIGRPPATAVITLEFANGGVGNVSVTDRMSYERGWEVVTVIGGGGICIEVDNSVEMNAYKFAEPIAAHKPEFVAGTSLSSVEQGFTGELQAFVDAIRDGTIPDAAMTEIAHTMAVLDAIKKSMPTGSLVKVEDVQ
jgi:predicted dehydrogenase